MHTLQGSFYRKVLRQRAQGSWMRPTYSVPPIIVAQMPVSIQKLVPRGLRIGAAMPEILFQPAQAFVNIVQGVRVGEAKIAFAVGTEVDARSDSDLSVFEDVEGQRIGLAPKTSGLGKDVKGAGRLVLDA